MSEFFSFLGSLKNYEVKSFTYSKITIFKTDYFSKNVIL